MSRLIALTGDVLPVLIDAAADIVGVSIATRRPDHPMSDLEAHEVIARRMLRAAGYGYIDDELTFANGAAWISRALTPEESAAIKPILAGALRASTT